MHKIPLFTGITPIHTIELFLMLYPRDRITDLIFSNALFPGSKSQRHFLDSLACRAAPSLISKSLTTLATSSLPLVLDLPWAQE